MSLKTDHPLQIAHQMLSEPTNLDLDRIAQQRQRKARAAGDIEYRLAGPQLQQLHGPPAQGHGAPRASGDRRRRPRHLVV